MTAAVDRELAPRYRDALDQHVVGCDPCRHELASTERLMHALAVLPMDAAVPERLEQATLRRVRLAASDEEESVHRAGWFRLRIPVFAVATAAVVFLAVGIFVRTGGVPAPPVAVTARPKPAGERLARAEPTRPPVARSRMHHHVEPPTEPPAELAAAPDLFMNLPILKNMERLEHFEAIRTTTLEDQAPNGQGEPSNG